MKPEDIQKSPKLFCENIKLAYTPEYFVLALSSGSQAQTYSLTPGHAKRLLQYLQHNLKEYEGKHGEITAEWNPNVLSPLQKSNDPTEGS